MQQAQQPVVMCKQIPMLLQRPVQPLLAPRTRSQRSPLTLLRLALQRSPKQR
jgi:hypothetical protein